MTDTPTRPVIPARVRDYAYPIALAVLALAGGYGLISEHVIALWGALAVAVLGLGTATAYRPARSIPAGTGEHRANE